MIKKCTNLIQNVMKKSKKRIWICNRIRELEKIENKTDKDIRDLCSAYDTLTWIPFTGNNIINKLCQECDFNKYRNS